MAFDIPAFHATLNATSGCCLALGFYCIKTKRMAAHVACMIGAAASSTVFLVSYVLYHARVGAASAHYQGTGWSRPLYFGILIVHTILAVVIVPMAARTVWLAARRRFASHRGLARWTFPLWLTVSVTGLVVYWMLYHRA